MAEQALAGPSDVVCCPTSCPAPRLGRYPHQTIRPRASSFPAPRLLWRRFSCARCFTSSHLSLASPCLRPPANSLSNPWARLGGRAGRQAGLSWAGWESTGRGDSSSMTLMSITLKLTLPSSSQTTALLPLLRIAFLSVECSCSSFQTFASSFLSSSRRAFSGPRPESVRATFLHSKTGWWSSVASRLFIALPPLALVSPLSGPPPARSFFCRPPPPPHAPSGESHLTRANARIYPPARQNQPWAVSPSARLSLILYPGWVPVPRSRRAAQHRRTGHGASILACKPSQQILPASRLRRAHNKAVSPVRGPIKAPQLRSSSPAPPPLCPPPSVVLLACIAAVSRYSQISTAARCRNRWFVYINHHRVFGVTSAPVPQSPHLRYFLQKEDSLLFPPRPSVPNPGQDLTSPCSLSCCYPSEYPHTHPSSPGSPTPVGINCWIPWKHLLELKFPIPPASCEIFSTRLLPSCPCLLFSYPFPETWLNVLASGGSEWPHMPTAQARHVTTRSSNIHISISLGGL